MTNYTLVSIEGNIGAGKTTLFDELKKTHADNPQYIFIKEPVDEWTKIKDQHNCSILQKFYLNQEAYSFPFQITALTTRLSILRNIITTVSNQPDKHYIIFTERSLQTDKKVFATMLRDQGKLEDICFQIYLNLFNEFARQYTTNYVIYVKTDAKICYDRVHYRARSGEETIPMQYLNDCHKYHEYFLDDLTKSDKMLTLNGNIDIYKEANILKKWIDEIGAFLSVLNKNN